jgi:transposase
MARITEALPHLSQEDILDKIKETVGFRRVQKWLVIWNATVDPRPAREIALHTGMAEQSVHNLISRYNRFGPSALSGPGKGGRRRAYMTGEEEVEFMKPFVQTALEGRIPSTAEIQEALEERLERKVHKTTVYRILNRNGWRKVVAESLRKAAKYKDGIKS